MRGTGWRAPFLIVLACVGALAQVPVITSNGVVNGASGLAGIASGSWITIFGTNLSTATRIWAAADFQGGRLPLSLDGVSVKVNNRDAALYFISPTQINALALADTALGSVTVTVTTPRGTSAGSVATYQQYAPGFFTFDPQNHIYPAAVYPSGTLVGRANLLGAAVTTVPAAPGDRILLFGTGFGPTAPQVDPANTFQGAAPLATPRDLSISVGGVPATVEFAGLVGNGLYQFNIVVPNVPDGDQTLVAQIGGQRSQSSLRLTVQTPPKPQIQYPGLTPQDALGCSGLATLACGTVTASPGEQIDFWVTGTNLGTVTGIQFLPPDGVDVSQVQATADSVHAVLTVSSGAALGKRKFVVTSPGGDSNQSPGSLNVSTFRISNLRIGTVTNTDNTLSIPVTLDYSDPTGAVSSGPLNIDKTLIFGNTAMTAYPQINPDGRTPGATSGVITFITTFSQVRGTTGAVFYITLGAKDGRASDTLQKGF